MTGIYLIRNKINNKKYIGQAHDIKDRWKGHIGALRNNKHGNDYLQKSWNKYGEDNFEFKVLQECDEEDLDTFETLYINILKTLAPDGYNLKEGGSSNKLSEEAKKKISEALKGKSPWNKGKTGKSAWNKGKKLSEEYKQKISESTKIAMNNTKTKEKISKVHKGKKLSEEHKQKISEASKKYWNNKRSNF